MRILLIDTEVSPSLGWFYRLYDTDILHVEEEWKLLSVCCKFLGEKAETKCLPDFQGSEERLVRWAYRHLEKADVVVGHNIDGFDRKKLNARFIFYGLKPPPPYQTVDTLKIARKNFGFTSNKLGDLGTHLSLGSKISIDKETWFGCLKGNKKDWEKMRRYNQQDVLLLEKIYLKLRPWGAHPNVGMWHEATVCSKCSSKDLGSDGYRRTATMLYKRIICNACGNRMKVPKAEKRDKPLSSL